MGEEAPVVELEASEGERRGQVGSHRKQQPHRCRRCQSRTSLLMCGERPKTVDCERRYHGRDSW